MSIASISAFFQIAWRQINISSRQDDILSFMRLPASWRIAQMKDIIICLLIKPLSYKLCWHFRPFVVTQWKLISWMSWKQTGGEFGRCKLNIIVAHGGLMGVESRCSRSGFFLISNKLSIPRFHILNFLPGLNACSRRMEASVIPTYYHFGTEIENTEGAWWAICMAIRFNWAWKPILQIEACRLLSEIMNEAATLKQSEAIFWAKIN